MPNPITTLSNPYNVVHPPRFINDDFLKTLDISVFDVETTGTDVMGQDRICSIAVQRLKYGQVLKPIYSLVDPEMIIPPSASNVHGITNFLLHQQQAPKLDQLIDTIADYVGDSIRVAHNAVFDRAFINPSIFLENGYTRTHWVEPAEAFQWKKQYQGTVGSRWLCTMRLAHHCFRAHYGYADCSLSNNGLRFWLEPQYTFTGMPHNALNDVQTTIHNLRHILSYAQHSMGIKTLDGLFELQNQNMESNVLQFSKHKGELLENVPDSYLKWLLTYENTSYEMGILVDAELKQRRQQHRNVAETTSMPSGTGIFAGQYRTKQETITMPVKQFKTNFSK